MQLSVLHSFLGDKEIDFDPETEEGRQKLGETLTKLLRAGTAIFLERADKTYRITGWDSNTDKIIVQNPGRWPTGEEKHEEETVGASLPESQPEKRAKKTVRAGLRRGRMTAVANTAGG